MSGIILNPAQEHAATCIGRNVLVSAGAGTGKTRVLVERFLYLVTQKHVPVNEILALTYTEKAANEMKSRILARLQEKGLEHERRELENAYISTIHSFASRMLREHPLEAGVDPDFRVLESEESDYMKEQALDETLETCCRKGTPLFDLLRMMGENALREGAIHVMDVARHSGSYLPEFFSTASSVITKESIYPAEKGKSIKNLFLKLGETDLASDWEQYYSKGVWDWATAAEFFEWKKTFSRKRGKKGDDSWQIIKEACDQLRAFHAEKMSLPYRQAFEEFALQVEAKYEAGKSERSVLDFDDLQIRAVRLFKSEGKIHQKLRERYCAKFQFLLMDEFQDTNFLQLELMELLSRGDNLFLVGDYKQSIYGFRGAEPALFLSKEQNFKQKKAGEYVVLNKNYRTLPAVLKILNGMFEQLWLEDGFRYEALEPGIEDSSQGGIELLAVEKREKEETSAARLREAERIARRIADLKEQGVAYGEIAILFQAVTDMALYEQALKRHGIPYYALSSKGFYHQAEVRDVLSYLSFLDNPHSDIPLAASLRSPLFQVRDETLYWLSRTAKTGEGTSKTSALYRGVLRYQAINEITESEKQKIAFFLQVTQSLCELKDRLRLTELLDSLLAKTSYELTVLAHPQGTRRYANLKKLMRLAREFEAAEPMALGAFLKTVRRLESAEVRESEAQTESQESGRLVRLMTVHRAKGLEFPVVFLADLGRTRTSGEASSVMAMSGLGYGIRLLNPLSQKWEEPALWKNIALKLKEKEKEESKRLFYVAATRAQKRLIFSGISDSKKTEKETFSEMNQWMDWVLSLSNDHDQIWRHPPQIPFPAAKEKAFAETNELDEIFSSFEPQPEEKLWARLSTDKEMIQEAAAKILEKSRQSEILPSRTIDLPVSAFALFQRSREDYRRVYEIGCRDTSWEQEVSREEQTEEVQLSAADFGTAFHSVMQYLDFHHPETNREMLLEKAYRSTGKEDKNRARTMLLAFIQTPLFAELQQAERIERELPFLLNERHGLIHGILDLLFQDRQGQWHILDYKTGKGDEEKVKTSGYQRQMELYAHAVYRIMKIAPASAILYFTDNQWVRRYPFTTVQMENIANEIRLEQEEILAFKNRQM